MSHDPAAYALGQLIGGTASDVWQLHENRRIQNIINQLATQRNQLQAQLNQVAQERNQLQAQLNQVAQERNQLVHDLEISHLGIQERDAQIQERDAQIQERDAKLFMANQTLRDTKAGRYDKEEFPKLVYVARDLVHHRAHRLVFRAALAEVAPDHPLIKDDRLRESIAKAAEFEWVQHNFRPGEYWFTIDGLGATIPELPSARLLRCPWPLVDEATMGYYRAHMEQLRRRQQMEKDAEKAAKKAVDRA